MSFTFGAATDGRCAVGLATMGRSRPPRPTCCTAGSAVPVVGAGRPGPATAGRPGPAIAGKPGPAIAGKPGPAIAGRPGPAIAGRPGPTIAGRPAPAIAGRPGPATAGKPGSTTAGSAVPETEGRSRSPKARFGSRRSGFSCLSGFADTVGRSISPRL